MTFSTLNQLRRRREKHGKTLPDNYEKGGDGKVFCLLTVLRLPVKGEWGKKAGKTGGNVWKLGGSCGAIVPLYWKSFFLCLPT